MQDMQTGISSGFSERLDSAVIGIIMLIIAFGGHMRHVRSTTPLSAGNMPMTRTGPPIVADAETPARIFTYE